MPHYCAVVGCRSNGRMPGRHFFQFPLLNNSNKKSLAFSQTRQNAWYRALNRSGFSAENFKYARVCDLHFVSGKAAKLYEVDDPDWVPTLRMGYGENEAGNSGNESNEAAFREVCDLSLCVSDTLDECDTQEISDTLEVCDTQDLFEHSVIVNEATDEFDDQRFHSKGTQTVAENMIANSTQTDPTITGMSDETLLSLKEQLQMLEEMLAIHNVTLDNFKGDNKKTNFFTGISHFATLEALFEMCEPQIGISVKLTAFQIFFIVLSRLRLNLSFRFLSYQFNVTVQTISRHFHTCLLLMYKKMKKFVYWPDREAIKKTMPLSFKRNFRDSVVVIVDCFEIFIEKPSNQKAMAQCFSSYKHAYTIKYLIGVTPQGFIAFISQGFGGRASDKHVTENCGFLDKLQLGDVVMADRGFLIEDELKSRGVELNIPVFTRGKTQLHPREIEYTRNIANVRIHVERLIGQLRQKFTVLHQLKFPITLIKKNKSSVNTIDQILTVCSALSNLCSPIVCKFNANESL